MFDRPSSLLRRWLEGPLSEAALLWLDGQRATIQHASRARDLNLAVSLVPRKLPAGWLVLDAAEQEAAEVAVPGWRPACWQVADAARIYLLLAVDDVPHHLRQLCVTADVAELVAFHRGLAVYPEPERCLPQATEGLRTNMPPVFEAVAHHNPFPAAHFPRDPWNQMVLKALFIGSPLHPIQGLDARANEELARMLVDYARERRAAARAVSPELWRCVGPYAATTPGALELLETVLTEGDEVERRAAALAMSAGGAESCRCLNRHRPDLHDAVAEGRLGWNALTAELPHR